VAYTVEFAESVEDHLRALTARDRATTLAAIERQLVHEPLTETRTGSHYGRTRSPRGELRVGELRVFYEVLGSDTGVVRVLAVGRKRRNTLMIGGEEIEL